MKKAINLISVILLLLGSTFKLESWPMANIILVIGSLSLLVGVLFIGYKENETNELSTIQNIVVTLGFSTLVLGSLFKFMHWPNATALQLTTVILFLIIIMMSITEKSIIEKISSQFLFTAMLILCLVIMLGKKNSRQTEIDMANHKCENCDMQHSSDTTKAISDTTKK
jgi:hypothetical protein